MAAEPIRVRFTRHGEDKLMEVGATRQQVTDAVLDGHDRRRKNPKEADWLVVTGRFRIAYNWPDRGDSTTALVVTVWRR